MADNIVQGLFGLTPEAYQLQQDQAAREQAMQFAGMNPFQRAAYGTFLGANQLGGAIGGALGAQDPMLQMIGKQQELLKTLNFNDPASLIKGAQVASAFSPQLANALADKANSLQASLVEQGQKAATANKALVEAGKITTEQNALKANVNQLMNQFGMTEEQATGIASNSDLLKDYLKPKAAQAFKLLETGKFTPESLVKWEKGIGQPELIDLAAKPSEDWLRIAKGMGLPAQSSFNAYTPEQVSAVNKELFNQDIAKKAAGAAVTNTVFKQEGAFASARGTKQAALIDEATTNAVNARNTINTIQSMKEKNMTGKLYSGPQANVSLETANFLESLNLLSADQTRRLTDSTAYDKFAKDLVMKDLNGKLGAQVSDADRKYVEARIPQLTTNPQARTELLNKLEEIANGKINFYNKLNEHANKYNNLNTFDFSQNYAPVAPKVSATPAGAGPVDFGSLKR